MVGVQHPEGRTQPVHVQCTGQTVGRLHVLDRAGTVRLELGVVAFEALLLGEGGPHRPHPTRGVEVVAARSRSLPASLPSSLPRRVTGPIAVSKVNVSLEVTSWSTSR